MHGIIFKINDNSIHVSFGGLLMKLTDINIEQDLIDKKTTDDASDTPTEVLEREITQAIKDKAPTATKVELLYNSFYKTKKGDNDRSYTVLAKNPEQRMAAIEKWNNKGWLDEELNKALKERSFNEKELAE